VLIRKEKNLNKIELIELVNRIVDSKQFSECSNEYRNQIK
jgi:hypothetical protein